jgi:hypothetical protein
MQDALAKVELLEFRKVDGAQRTHERPQRVSQITRCRRHLTRGLRRRKVEDDDRRRRQSDVL